VLSTSEAISDLLDQRSAIYSDKVRTPRHTLRTLNFNCPSLPLLAVYSDDRFVSFRGLLNLVDPIWSPGVGWAAVTPLWLSCPTGPSGARTESCSPILSAFQPSRTTMRIRSRWYRTSLSTFTKDQRPSGNISICTHSTPCDPDPFNLQHYLQAHRLAGSLYHVRDSCGYPGQQVPSFVQGYDAFIYRSIRSWNVLS
jgi:hypothetical protein